MRLKALIHNHNRYKKAIIYQAPEAGVYLFLYDTVADASCIADHWFETREEAQDEASDMFGIDPHNWMPIADPLPGAQHDWEQPTRLVVTETGTTHFIPHNATQYEQGHENAMPAGTSLERANDDLVANITQLLRAGQHITAIKVYRQQANVTLSEAKAAIEHLVKRIFRQDSDKL